MQSRCNYPYPAERQQSHGASSPVLESPKIDACAVISQYPAICQSPYLMGHPVAQARNLGFTLDSSFFLMYHHEMQTHEFP